MLSVSIRQQEGKSAQKINEIYSSAGFSTLLMIPQAALLFINCTQDINSLLSSYNKFHNQRRRLFAHSAKPETKFLFPLPIRYIISQAKKIIQELFMMRLNYFLAHEYKGRSSNVWKAAY
jgi:hypothetical protein